MRLVIGPSPRTIDLPSHYTPQMGQGIPMTEGDDGVLFSYGPVMLHESLRASEALAGKGLGLQVVNMPWLNRVDGGWLAEAIHPYRHLFVLDDHSPVGGLGDTLVCALAQEGLLESRTVVKFGVDGHPAWGTPAEVLKHHGLDGNSLAAKIQALCTA